MIFFYHIKEVSVEVTVVLVEAMEEEAMVEVDLVIHTVVSAVKASVAKVLVDKVSVAKVLADKVLVADTEVDTEVDTVHPMDMAFNKVA